MSFDTWDSDPAFIEYARRVIDELVPKLEDSALTVSLVPRGATDVKFAVELGLSIMLDKPIILMVEPGTKVPAQLAKVAAEIVEADLSRPERSAARMRAAILRVMGDD